MIHLLTVLLLILTIINYHIAKTDLLNPGVAISGMFFVFSACSSLASVYIGIDLNDFYSIFLITLGISVITAVNYIAPKKKITSKEICYINYKRYRFIEILISIIIFITIYVSYKYIIELAAAYGVGGSFFECIVLYKTVATFADPSEILVPSPWHRGILMLISESGVYFVMYVFMYDKVMRNKFYKISLLPIVLYFILSLMSGGRTELFRLISALCCFWIFFTKQKYKNRNLHLVWKMFGVMVFSAMIFIGMLVIVGRSDESFDIELIATQIFIYAGAPIFNFDIYLNNPWGQSFGYFGEMTFTGIIQWLGKRMGDINMSYVIDLPFQMYGNYSLGNVYTTFYAFHYDFGAFGVLFLMLIMGILVNYFYNKMNMCGLYISAWVVFYAYLFNDLLMLPFSNRFYGTIADVKFLKLLFIWYMLCYILRNNALSKSYRRYVVK